MIDIEPMATRAVLRKLAASLKGSRIIGSIEDVEQFDDKVVQDVAEQFGLLYVIEPYESKYEIIYAKPEAAEALKRHLKYLRGLASMSALTPTEHYEQGLAFGLPKTRARWFKGEATHKLRLERNPTYAARVKRSWDRQHELATELVKYGIQWKFKDTGIIVFDRILSERDQNIVTDVATQYDFKVRRFDSGYVEVQKRDVSRVFLTYKGR